ncbi:hypothetical protein [Streptomyces sp. H27-C3]|uniref:hypothetical protein n=1 Tax=Streptomyces sp. H27-C3 TaxID=3046305 RepID=UPI0024B9496D|nr:hypothetical protein [Streptomyces sp. H27-C3]MDJ0462622.1 hypothetical protein [Streptomyces sp. H27-C3]
MHGTGVREPSYTKALEGIRAGLSRFRPDVRVEPCDWGSALGSYLRAGGVSIPGYPEYAAAAESRGSGPPAVEECEDDEDRLRWAMLYADPFAELGAYTLAQHSSGGSAGAGFVPGAAPFGDQLMDAVGRLDTAAAVSGAWGAVAPGLSTADVVAAVSTAREFRGAVASPPADGSALPRLTARAITAWAMAHADEEPGAVAVAARDELVDVLTNELGGDTKGLSDVLVAALGFSARLFERSLGSGMIVSRRAALSSRSVGFVGDVLSYLARGQAVRDYVADTVRALPGPGPVVVLGHSLGGIIAVDLLADPASGLAVDLLVTVGSQAPLLYELDALPSLPYGTGLPDAFPPWVNVHDRRDLLSYLAAGAFGNDPRITDAPVDNGQPVSAAHSSYWANDDFYRVFSEVLPG